MENYQIQHKLGSGNYAKVYLAKHATTNEEVALKLISKSALKNSKASDRIQSEMANMKTLSGHDNIVTLHDCFETKEYHAIAMEYVSEGELFDFVQKQGGMKEEAAREMFSKILNGVQHIHSKGIAHRDLKLENILLDKENNPKIADFGFSKDISTYPIYASSVGSLLYSSPEIVQGKPYQGPECDVWSLGVILYTMLTATMPFDDSNMGQFLVKIENGDYPVPFGVSNAVRDLISRMLNPDPNARYTVKDILAHPWMVSLRNGKTTQQKTRRRYGVCYKSSENIRSALLALNDCDCSCHRVDLLKHGRDSVITKHCTDCDDFQANDPEIMMRRQMQLSRNSSVSSGYGSEFGSQMHLPSPEEPQVNILGSDFSPILRQRSSVPRKSSASTISNSTLVSKISHHRCSVPILQEATSDDEDIVFV